MSLLTFERPNGDYVARLPAWTDRQKRLGLPVTVSWKCEYGEHSEADLVKVLAHAKKTGATLGVSYDPNDALAHASGDPLDVDPRDDRLNIARLEHYAQLIAEAGTSIGSVYVDGAIEYYESKIDGFKRVGDYLKVRRIYRRYDALLDHAGILGHDDSIAMYSAYRMTPEVRMSGGVIKISKFRPQNMECGELCAYDAWCWYDRHVHSATLARNASTGKSLVPSHWVGMAKVWNGTGWEDKGATDPTGRQHECGRLYRGVEGLIQSIWTYWDSRAIPAEVDKQTTELLTGIASG